MSLGQTMISIATLVALTIMVVTSQRYVIEGQKEAVAAECLDLAAMHAEALINEISRKNYDATTTYNYYQPTSEFTGAGSLGPNSGELALINPWPDVSPYKSIAAYSDVDDYDGYQRIVNTDLVNNLTLSVQVYYVSETNPTQKVYYTTYLKRVVVTVQQTTYLSPITFTSLVAY